MTDNIGISISHLYNPRNRWHTDEAVTAWQYWRRSLQMITFANRERSRISRSLDNTNATFVVFTRTYNALSFLYTTMARAIRLHDISRRNNLTYPEMVLNTLNPNCIVNYEIPSLKYRLQMDITSNSLAWVTIFNAHYVHTYTNIAMLREN